MGKEAFCRSDKVEFDRATGMIELGNKKATKNIFQSPPSLRFGRAGLLYLNSVIEVRKQY